MPHYLLDLLLEIFTQQLHQQTYTLLANLYLIALTIHTYMKNRLELMKAVQLMQQKPTTKNYRREMQTLLKVL